jgi:hypothetical protein
MSRIIAAIVVLVVCAASFADAVVKSSDAGLDAQWLQRMLTNPEELGQHLDAKLGPQWREPAGASPAKLIKSLVEGLDLAPHLEMRMKQHAELKRLGKTDMVSPYWRFVPLLEGSPALGGSVIFSTACFQHVNVTVDSSTNNLDGELLGVTLTATDPINLNCMSEWVFMTAGHTTSYLAEVPTYGQRVFINVTGLTTSERWLMTQYGVRVLTANASHFEVYASVLDTLLLFLPSITGYQDPITEADNMQYFNTFTQMQPPVQYRANPGLTGLPESEISDGDVLFVSDMEGMGTTIAIGTGSSANHVAVCLRNASGVLHVCESTSPKIVCTPYAPWIVNQDAATRSVVLAPLAPQFSSAFNTTAAWEFINATVGFEYGYPNFLFGWLDTPNANMPCMPPDFKRCLDWAHVEYTALFLQRLSPALAAKFFGQALNHRINTTGLAVADVLYAAWNASGLVNGDIIAIPEQDSWLYDTTRYGLATVGPSQVCSTYGCNVLKHAGVFAGTPLEGTIQCGEQAPWNMLALQLFDAAKLGNNRPAICQLRDPANPYCQLTGHTTFTPDLTPNEKPLTAHTGETCPSINPAYNRSETC